MEDLRAKLVGVAGIQSIAKLDGFGGPRLIYATVEKKAAGDGGRAIEAIWDATPAGFGDCVFIAAHEGDGGGSADPERVLFQVAANTCPRRDRWTRGERVGFDGTPKRGGDERLGEAVRDFPPGVGGLPVAQGID
ncbi:MAG: hypothetical protein IT459_22900 [Planctomycetes bacterium]|nr:hypothetical protein [Planctomycetota bacterium]